MKLRSQPVTPHEQGIGAFYQCENSVSCGLRFPVGWNDPFSYECPLCKANVRLVAQVDSGDDANTALDLGPSSPPSKIRLLLDNWRSVFNVGAAFRTADGAGIAHIYLCGISATPETQRKLAKTALGAEKHVGWSYHPNSVKLGAELRDAGAEMWVLERNPRSVPLFDTDFAITEGADYRSIALAAGNEVMGVDPGLVAMADRVIALPMFGSKESLNVAVALSVATYWLRAKELAMLLNQSKQ